MIRKAKSSDLTAISKLNDHVQTMHADNLPHLFKQATDDTHFCDWFKGLFEDPSSYVVVAVESENIVGYLYASEKKVDDSWVTKSHRSFHLEHIAVNPYNQKKGYGKGLIEAFKNEAERREIDDLTLEVWNFNDEARRCFSRMGFTPTSFKMSMTGIKSPPEETVNAIIYKNGNNLNLDEFIELYRSSTLGERRPIHNRAVMKSMLENGDLTITAWDNARLIGIARTLTDFANVAYLADLAVDIEYQNRGVGKELVSKTREALADTCSIVLLSSPDANEYYPKIGFEHHPRAWTVDPIKNP